MGNGRILNDESGVARANDWANGFMRGMEMRRDAWAGLMNDEEQWFACSYPRAGARTPSRPRNAPVQRADQRRNARGADRQRSCWCGGDLRLFEAERVLGARRRGSATTFRRDAPKVGRNELCPCGSGKKFKHCCAKATLH